MTAQFCLHGVRVGDMCRKLPFFGREWPDVTRAFQELVLFFVFAAFLSSNSPMCFRGPEGAVTCKADTVVVYCFEYLFTVFWQWGQDCMQQLVCLRARDKTSVDSKSACPF